MSSFDRSLILDPETGEVLATNEDDRREVVQLLAAEIIGIQKQMDRLPELHRKLEALMDVGDTAAYQGYAVACELGPRPARQINRQEVLVHAESLAEFGLAPREEVTTRVVYPKVSEFTTSKAKADLARAGLNVNAFLLDGGEPRPTIKIYAPKESA